MGRNCSQLDIDESIELNCLRAAGCSTREIGRLMISRRKFLTGMLSFTAAGLALSAYGSAQPYGLRVTRYAVSPPRWPDGLNLKLAVLADLHVIDPWMNLDRIAQIVERTNELQPDAVLLLGDYLPNATLKKWAERIGGGVIAPSSWAHELSKLSAPNGVHAVLGNHDWWQDQIAQRRGSGPTIAATALQKSGISVYENDSVRLSKDGDAFWIAGLGDQQAICGQRSTPPRKSITSSEATKWGNCLGLDDLRGTLQKIDDAAPVILMAHEPDIFANMGEFADRVSLTISGHTHGGQIRILNYAPIVPSRYGNRYAYGHVVEGYRHLIVSAGLGYSNLPIRIAAHPEIVIVDIKTETTSAQPHLMDPGCC